MEAPALFVRDGDAYVPTILTQGGWDPTHANGGSVLALLGQALDAVPTLVPMTVSRFTTDLVRPMVIGQPYQVAHEVIREGKKIQVVALRLLSAATGVDHARVTALRLRDHDVSGNDDLPPSTTEERPADHLLGPEEVPRLGQRADVSVGSLHAFDMRRVRRRDGGPGVYWWIRLDAEVVAGEGVTPTARLTYCFDFANLIGIEPVLHAVTLINPDVTAQVLRAPRGEWVGVTGDSRFEPVMGRGISVATLSDFDGPFAVVTTSQLIQPVGSAPA